VNTNCTLLMGRSSCNCLLYADRGRSSRTPAERRGATAVPAVRRTCQRALPGRPRGNEPALLRGAAAVVRRTLRAAAALREPLCVRRSHMCPRVPRSNGHWCAQRLLLTQRAVATISARAWSSDGGIDFKTAVIDDKPRTTARQLRGRRPFLAKPGA